MAELKKRASTDLIVVHCSATPEAMDIGAADIDLWHRAKGWLGIGYHYVIRRDGTIETGRPLEVYGAHARGHNHNSVGVCMVGGVDADSKRRAEVNYTPQQWASLGFVIGRLDALYPDALVVGHNDLDPLKACPAFNVREYLTGMVGD